MKAQWRLWAQGQAAARRSRHILIWNNITAPRQGSFKCQIGIHRSHHLGKVVACISSSAPLPPWPPPPPSPPPPPPTRCPCAGSDHFQPQIGSDRPLKQRCLPSPPSAAVQPLRWAVSLIICQRRREGWRCPAGDRALNTSSVLLLHVCWCT